MADRFFVYDTRDGKVHLRMDRADACSFDNKNWKVIELDPTIADQEMEQGNRHLCCHGLLTLHTHVTDPDFEEKRQQKMDFVTRVQNAQGLSELRSVIAQYMQFNPIK